MSYAPANPHEHPNATFIRKAAAGALHYPNIAAHSAEHFFGTSEDVAAMGAQLMAENAAQEHVQQEADASTSALPPATTAPSKRALEARTSPAAKRGRGNLQPQNQQQQRNNSSNGTGGGTADSNHNGSTGPSHQADPQQRIASDPLRGVPSAGTAAVSSSGTSGASGRQLSSSKRAQQNREAQRAFRQRKDQHVKELEQKAASLERALTSGEDHKRRCVEALAKLEAVTRENERLRALLHQHGLAHLADAWNEGGGGGRLTDGTASVDAGVQAARAGLDNALSAQEPFYGSSKKGTTQKT